MRLTPALFALVTLACTNERPPAALSAAHAVALQDSARAFATAVAQGVSANGPTAWSAFFVDRPDFFMASEGKLVFASGDAAAQGIRGLPRVIRHIELQWLDSIRVDPLAPGLVALAMAYHEARVDSAGRRMDEGGFFTGIAEHGASGWRFRQAHWSVLPPPREVH